MANINTQVVLQYLEENAAKFDVDPALAKQIFLSENMGRNNDGSFTIPAIIDTETVSKKGARGLMQVMPNTHAGLIKERYLPEGHTLDNWTAQLDAGLAALKAKQKEHGTKDPRIIAAAYNAGNRGAEAAKAGNYEQLPAETQQYLLKMDFARKFLQPQASQRDVRRAETGISAPSTPLSSNETTQRGLEAFASTMTEYQTTLDTLIADTVSSTNKAIDAKLDVATAIIEAGNRAGAMAATTGTIEAATEHMKERTAAMLRLDTRNANNLIAEQLNRQAFIKGRMEPLRREIDARMSVGFFDNPLQWLINETILPGQVSAYNAMVREYHDSVEEISTAQNVAERQNRIDVAGIADEYTKRGVELANLKIAEANAKAAEVKADAAALAAQKSLQVARLTGEQIATHGRQVATLLELEGRAEKQQLKREEIERLNDLRVKLNRVATAIGAPGITVERLKALPKEQQAMWDAAINTNSFGDSFAEVTLFLASQGNVNRMPQEFGQMQKAFQEKIDKNMKEEYTTWPVKHPGVKIPSQAELFRMVAKDLGTQFERENATNLATADNANPYKASHFLTVQQWTGNKENIVFKKVQEALKKNVNINDSIILKMITDEVTALTLKPADAAAALEEYYTQVIARNNRARDITGMGLKKQESYNVIRPGAGIFVQDKSINLINRTEVERLLTQNAIHGAVMKGMPEAAGMRNF